MLYQQLTKEMKFREAFDIWLGHRMIPQAGLASKASYLSQNTIDDYNVGARALEKFFAHIPIGKIRPLHLTKYQNARVICDKSIADWKQPAGANCIRKEVSLLTRILREVGTWKEADDKSLVRLRAEEIDVPRAMTPDEQHRFLHIAASRVEFHFVYWYTILGLHTTCSVGELRCLRIGDVHVADELIHVRKASAKNKYRIRTIPLGSKDAVWALERVIERARSLGATSPQHYLFPIQKTPGTYDATHPMSESGLKKRWAEVREAAGLDWLKPNGLRHTAITRLAEAGAPIHVILAIAGHVTFQMQKHYISVSLKSRKRWVDAAWSESAEVEVAGKKKPPMNVRPLGMAVVPREEGARRSPVWVSGTY